MKIWGILGLLLFLCSSCGSSISSTTPLIVGTWLTDTVKDTYGSDGTLTETITDSTLTVIQKANGTYTTNGSTLTIITTAATPAIPGLPKTFTYQFVINGSNLTLTTATGTVIKYTKQVN